MKKVIILAAFAAMAAASQATLLYSQTTSQTGSRANAGNANVITFDDVCIPLARLAGGNPPANKIDTTSVTVGIRRLANAGATTVNVFTAAIDTSLNLVPSSITLVGSQNLAANGASAVTQLVSVTDTSNFQTPLVFTTNYAYMVVGVQFTNTTDTANQGWRIMNDQGNADFTGSLGLGTGTAGTEVNLNAFWNWDTSTSTQSFLYFGFTGANQATNPPASFYTVLNGNVVPEPGTMAALGLGAVALIRRRRSSK